MTSSNAIAFISAGAFSNEFFGLIAHTMHLPVYNGDIKLFIDAIAIISAGTLATIHSMHDESSISSAYIAPSLFMKTLISCFRNEGKYY